MLNDTINPLARILNAIRGMSWRVLHSERGETGEGGEGAGGGEAGNAGGAGGGASENWRDSLPENIKANPIFEKYGSANDAHAALIDVQKLIGPEKIIMPSEGADQKEWNERVYDRLGRPKEAKDYVLPTDLTIPEGMPVQEEIVQSFKDAAHELGVLPKQFAGMYKWYMEKQATLFNETNTAIQTAKDEATKALRTKWGSAFDQNFALGEKVLNTFGDDATKKFVVDSGLRNNPAFIEFLSNVGKSFSEDQLAGKPAQLTKSPEEALAEIAKMENDLTGPLYDAAHPEHEAMMKKKDMLYRQAYPSG